MVAKFYALNVGAQIPLNSFLNNPSYRVYLELLQNQSKINLLIPENEVKIDTVKDTITFTNLSRAVPDLCGQITLPSICFKLHEYNLSEIPLFKITDETYCGVQYLYIVDESIDFGKIKDIEFLFDSDINFEGTDLNNFDYDFNTYAIAKIEDKYELIKVPNMFLEPTTLRDIMKDIE
jgi:hypothetical protein